MRKDELVRALRALAREHPYAEHVGYMWKNPLNPRSTGLRWSKTTLAMFREFQREYR
jgi:hypothetical protein